MGIRFACHACQKSLNIKTELSGKRGVCPQCGTRFRIPSDNSALSIPIEEPVAIESTEQTAFRTAATQSKVHAANGSSRSLLDDATAIWYVRPPSGGQYGPATSDVLRDWITEARVTSTSLIWRDGWPQWRSAGEVLTEFGASSDATPEPKRNVSREKSVVPLPSSPTLALDPNIGPRRKSLTNRRIIFVGSLVTISMTLIGVLIYLLQR